MITYMHLKSRVTPIAVMAVAGVVAGALVLSAPAALAQTSTKPTPTPGAAAKPFVKTVPAEKVFPFYEPYLKLAPAERSHMKMSYQFKVTGTEAKDLKIRLLSGQKVTPVTISPKGEPSVYPTLEDLKNKAQLQFEAPKEPKIAVSMQIVPTTPADTDIPVADLVKAIDQLNSGSRKMAGVLAMAIPKMNAIFVLGGTNGRAVMADGSQRPLPMVQAGKVAVFVPDNHKGATRLVFDTAPEQMQIGPYKPKKS